jgi:hypothetical protein
MAEPTMAAEASGADARAREAEEQMTDDERFSLIIGLFGAINVEGFSSHRTSGSRKGRR